MLAEHAMSVSMPGQREWIVAMVNELQQVPPGRASLSWALGCLFVSYTARMEGMARSLLNLPRWLLLLEMLLCLGPACAYFVCVAVSTMNGYMLFNPSPQYSSTQQGLVFGSATLVGPFGLVIAFRTLFLPTFRPSRIATGLLCVLVAWSLVVFAGLMRYFHVGLDILWPIIVPMVCLPAVAVAHLAWLNSLSQATQDR
jgi:hypothetical protein